MFLIFLILKMINLEVVKVKKKVFFFRGYVRVFGNKLNLVVVRLFSKESWLFLYLEVLCFCDCVWKILNVLINFNYIDKRKKGLIYFFGGINLE